MDTRDNYTYRYRGGSLEANDPTYVWRPADDELYQQLRLGEFCYVLTSRQMGKSSLRVQTMHRLQQDGIACVSIDLSAIGSQATPEQWYKGILYRLFRSLQLVDTVNWQTWWNDRSFLPVVQRLGDVIEGILLGSTTQNIVIFLDEIDSVMSVDFSTDDFFAFIRACYGQRSENPAYHRLTFCLLGVATPSDLIQDKRRTPFNIGHAIELGGLAFEQAHPILTRGLAGSVKEPAEILATILRWTGGQPFLTQKVCQLVVERAEDANPNVRAIIQTHMIENWEAKDEPEHLRTIRDRILYDQSKAIILLGRYQEILETTSSLQSDNGPDEIELRLSGLITIKNQCLTVANPIYQKVFNQDWINKQLAKLWIIRDEKLTPDQVIEPEIPKAYTTKVIVLNIVCIVISAISLYLHYGPFMGEARKLEFSDNAPLLSGLIEFSRMMMLLVSSSYVMYFVWYAKTLELWQGTSQKVTWFRRTAIAASALLLTLSAISNFWLAPDYLRNKYCAQIVVENDFVEYVLPSVLYFPYICIIHFIVAIPFTLASLHAVTGDLSSNWTRTIRLRRHVYDLINTHVAIPKHLKLKSIQSLFSKYALMLLNVANPYSTIFLGAQILWLFESRFGMSTLTESGQHLAVLTYAFSFTVVAIFVILFAQYQRAMNIASNALLYLEDEQLSTFRKEYQVSKLLTKIIGSNINFILLGLIVVATATNSLVNFVRGL